MKFLFLILLAFNITAFGQLSEKQLQEIHDKTKEVESMNVRMNESMNRSIEVMDSINRENFARQNERNLNAFMAERKEQEKKATQRMYLRLGFGVAMLIVLIVGLRRKKKAKEAV